MPLVYLGTGWFIGIALASALRLPLEFHLLAFLVPIVVSSSGGTIAARV